MRFQVSSVKGLRAARLHSNAARRWNAELSACRLDCSLNRCCLHRARVQTSGMCPRPPAGQRSDPVQSTRRREERPPPRRADPRCPPSDCQCPRSPTESDSRTRISREPQVPQTCTSSHAESRQTRCALQGFFATLHPRFQPGEVAHIVAHFSIQAQTAG